MVALLLVMMLTLQTPVYAYTMAIREKDLNGSDGAKAFSTKNSDFKNAKSPMYCSKSQTISGNISKKYYQDMYHYECQEGGYYAIYTTGNTDTVGAVYEEQDFLMYLSYDLLEKNDDRFSTKDRNFGVVADFDKYEDYYILVRGYGSNTGRYTLKIEPNEDKIFHSRSGVWKSDKIPLSAANNSFWVTDKIYLSKEQTVLFYWMLDPATKIVNGSASYTLQELDKKYKKKSISCT